MEREAEAVKVNAIVGLEVEVTEEYAEMETRVFPAHVGCGTNTPLNHSLLQRKRNKKKDLISIQTAMQTHHANCNKDNSSNRDSSCRKNNNCSKGCSSRKNGKED